VPFDDLYVRDATVLNGGPQTLNALRTKFAREYPTVGPDMFGDGDGELSAASADLRYDVAGLQAQGFDEALGVRSVVLRPAWACQKNYRRQ
jgi:hypothetical protein